MRTRVLFLATATLVVTAYASRAWAETPQLEQSKAAISGEKASKAIPTPPKSEASPKLTKSDSKYRPAGYYPRPVVHVPVYIPVPRPVPRPVLIPVPRPHHHHPRPLPPPRPHHHHSHW